MFQVQYFVPRYFPANYFAEQLAVTQVANIPISQLPNAATVNAADLVPIVQGGVTKHATAGGIAALAQPGGTFLQASNNLSDLASAPTARTNLGLGTAATASTGTAAGNVPVLDSTAHLSAAIMPLSGVTAGTYKGADVTVNAAGAVTGITQGEDALPYFFPGVQLASSFQRVILPYGLLLPQSLSGSYAKAGAASTGTATVAINKISGGVTTQIGTVTFATSASATFTAANATNFAAGDMIEVKFPNPADTTLSDIAITLLATRT